MTLEEKRRELIDLWISVSQREPDNTDKLAGGRNLVSIEIWKIGHFLIRYHRVDGTPFSAVGVIYAKPTDYDDRFVFYNSIEMEGGIRDIYDPDNWSRRVSEYEIDEMLQTLKGLLVLDQLADV